MADLPPPIDMVTQPTDQDTSFEVAQSSVRRKLELPRRLMVFLAALLPALLLSLAFVWMREPIYESKATVLTTAQTDVDETDGKASPQHIAIQSQLLLGGPLLDDVLVRLHANGELDTASKVTIADLRSMLSVRPVAKTNVVEMVAKGSDFRYLPVLVNAWVDAYQEARTRDVQKRETTTSTGLTDELVELERRIAEKREALDQFRRAHNILSKESGDNEALARLKGLNESLNKSSDAEVKAKAELEAIREAIGEGKAVLPKGQERILADLEARAQQLREQVTKLHRLYTATYIALDPALKVIPEQLRKIERELAEKRELSAQAAVTEAEQAYRSARQSTQAIRAQMEENKRGAAEFTTRFAEHKAMEGELTDLEKLYRKKQERLVKIEVKPTEELPQLEVVDRASQSNKPLWPNYQQDSLIAVGGSVLFGLLTVMLYEFLNAKPIREHVEPPVAVPNINVYSVPQNLLLSRQQAQSPQQLPVERPLAALDQLPPRELSEQEVRLLMEHAPIKTRLTIGLLLTGPSLDEIVRLRNRDFDLENRQLSIVGDHPRTLPLPRLVGDLFTECGSEINQDRPDESELEARIACSAVDSGLLNPAEANSAALRHSYILYLVRQGARLSELQRILGRLPAKILAWYGQYSPAGPGLRLEAIQLTHPALRGLATLYLTDE